jgi:sugar phosphate isomerase/epimerase
MAMKADANKGKKANNYPKLHNAAWPGVVGKTPGTDNPPIGLETMLDYTAAAEVNGRKFDGIDLFLFAPHVDIDSTEDDLKALAESVRRRGLVIGSLVAPVWPPTGGGPALDAGVGRKMFLQQLEKGCRIAQTLTDLGVRPYGVVRIDSACGVSEWAKDPEGNQKRIAETFKLGAAIASGYGQRLAAEGEICWGGMHSWRKMVDLLERVGEPETVGFQADMAHTLLYTLGYNAPEDRLLPENYDWKDKSVLDEALKTVTDALRPWTIDIHIAQNDATAFGSGTHDKTGRHCLPDDPNGKLDIPHVAGFWLNDAAGRATKAVKHLCWDGCMFPNIVMAQSRTWNSILAAMLAVRDAHGWA